MLKRCALYRWSVTEKRQGPILNSRFSGALDVSVERCFEFVFFLKMVKMVGVNYLCALHSSGTTILPAVSKIMKLSTIPLFYLSPSSTITTTRSKGKLIFTVTGKRFLWCLSSSTFVSSMIGGVVRTVSGREVSECFSV